MVGRQLRGASDEPEEAVRLVESKCARLPDLRCIVHGRWLVTTMNSCHAACGPDGDLVDLSQSPERAADSGAGRGETMLTCGSASGGWSSRLDGESKLSENLDGAGLPALEIT